MKQQVHLVRISSFPFCIIIILYKIDNTSERVVQDALEQTKKDRTTIVIAHRLSTIRNADLIIGLEHGQMIEYGTHEDLMERKGLYYELVTAQTQKETEKEVDTEGDNEDEEIKEEFIRQRSSI
jgi:ABC-type transport system involved in cytochrome bd biosynthesis fused ATPase/permease subunit